MPTLDRRIGLDVTRENLEGAHQRSNERSGIVVVGADAMPPKFAWEHRSSRGFERDVQEAIAVAKTSAWKGGEPAHFVRLFRALLLGQCAMWDLYSEKEIPIVPDPLQTGTGIDAMEIGPRTEDDYRGALNEPDSDRREFAWTTLRAMNVLAASMMKEALAGKMKGGFYPQIVTIDGSEATYPPGGIPGYNGGAGATNTPIDLSKEGRTVLGLGWPAAVAIIVGVAAATYLAQNALEIWSNHLQRSDSTENLVQAAAKALEMQKAHWEEEEKRKEKIPLSEAEIAIVNALNQQSAVAAKSNDITLQPALPKLFPDTRGVLKDAEEAVTDLGSYAVLGAFGLGALFLFFNRGKSHKDW